jgi:hypothetical protein
LPPDWTTLAQKGLVLSYFTAFRSCAAALIAACFLFSAPTMAEMAPSSENGRYILQKTENGWFRVDTRSGQASLCSEGAAGFACTMVPDDRDAMLDEIERLNDRLVILERQIELAGEAPAGSGTDVAQAPSGDAAPSAGSDADAPDGNEQSTDLPSFMPSEEQMDEIMQGFESMVRRFLAMVQSLREEYGQGI